jgi:8-oxo-dGTP pyrophosphatase MutT (NUDIX family)
VTLQSGPDDEIIPPAIPAATVIVARDGDAGFDVLMVRRNRSIGFGGMWVFPGGKIEAGDGTNRDAARRAAVRELAEEAGIEVELEQLIPFSRWCPPPSAGKRFDTVFFVTRAPVGPVTVDGGEIEEHRWDRPGYLLELHGSGLLDLVVPTWVTLYHLARLHRVDDLVGPNGHGVMQTFVTHVRRDGDDHQVALWHGDASYHGAPLDAPGKRHRLTMAPDGWRYETVSHLP